MIKRLTRLIGWLMLIALASTALLTLSARWLLPAISEHRGVVEGLLTSRLGAPVSLGGVSGEWRGYGPEITLSDLRLHNREGGTRLRLARVTANLHLLDSLLAGRLMPRELTLHQLRILVQRRQDKSLVIAGLEGLEGSASDAGLTLIALPFRIHVTDTRVRFEDATGAFGPQQLDGIDLLLRGDQRRLQVSARLSPRYGSLRIDGELSGDPTRASGWDGEFYFHGEDTDLARLIGGALPGEVSIRQGLATTELWSQWRNGRLTRIRGETRINDAVISNPRGRFAFEALRGRYHWQRDSDDWRLDMDRLAFLRNGQRWEGLRDATLRFRRHPDNEEELAIRINRGIIQDIADLIRLMPPSTEVAEFLAQIEPRGRIAELTILLREGDQRPAWFLGGRIDRLTTNATAPLPALRNLGGRIAIEPQRGRLTLEENDGAIDFTTLFRDPIPFDTISGMVEWRIDDSGEVIIESDALRAANHDIETLTRFRMTLPANDDASPHLDLQSDFRNGDGKRVSPYLPTPLMDPATVAWLDTALLDGRVRDGVCLLRGPLDDFPFHHTNSGRFEVAFFVEDVELAYHPGWPRIAGLDAQVRFVDNRFEATASDGLLYGHRILHARAAIDSLHPTSPLTIQGSTAGPLEDGLRLLRETPLAKRFREPLQGIEVTGKTQIEIDLSLPLDQGEPSTRGVIHLAGNRLRLEQWQLDLDQVSGDLRFDENGLYAAPLHATLEGAAVRAEIGESNEYPDHTLISATAKLPAAKLTARYPALRRLNAAGASDWRLDIHLPPLSAPEDAPTHLRASSNLLGTTIDLPPPLAKGREEEAPFSLAAQLAARQLSQARLHYGDRLDAALRLHGDEGGNTSVDALEIAIGDADLLADAPGDQGLRLRVRMDELDLTPWAEAALADGGDLTLPPLDRAHLIIGNLHWREHTLNDLALRIGIQRDDGPEAWTGDIHSRRISGRFRYPREPVHGPATIELERLALRMGRNDGAMDDDNATTPPRAPPAIDPRQLPGFLASAEDLLINDEPMGRVALRAERSPHGLDLTAMEIGNDRHRLSGTGHWYQQPDGKQQSELAFDLASDSLGELLIRLGLAEKLQGAPARIAGRLSWPDGPFGAADEEMAGTLSLAILQGSAPEMDPGLGRLFGLLNITALHRRLSFDFSDLFGEGFSFDRIEGEVRFGDGEAKSDNLLIEGPAARIEITGSADLRDRTLDQRITVSGKVSSALPIAGTLTGGPAVGAALLIAQQLLGDKMDRISAAEYQISGPWDDPAVERINKGGDEDGAQPNRNTPPRP